jgi:hypothetical protein
MTPEQRPAEFRRLTRRQALAAVVASGLARGEQDEPPTERFAGYTWDIKTSGTPVGPGPNRFAAENVSSDRQGLHLKIALRNSEWNCAEVICRRPLGYGQYKFVVADVSHLDPNMVLGLFTWDTLSPRQNYREIDIELSQWGDPAAENAQFVLQPWDRKGHRIRFRMRPGIAEYSFEWTPGKVACHATVGSSVIQRHEFSSGVPTPGAAQLRMNFWLIESRPAERDTEVLIKNFSFKPWR